MGIRRDQQLRRTARVLVAAAALAASSGCEASFVETRRRVRGPVPEVGLIDPGGGHARYALKGPVWLVRKRRARAFRKMAGYCEGKDLIRIRKEYSRDDAVTPFQASDLDPAKLLESGHYKVESYRHIIFECIREP
ncbi:MAG: hypothetical protein ABII00_02090 [Elusimicrobiota bacterium]